jgi:hypothetical protein
MKMFELAKFYVAVGVRAGNRCAVYVDTQPPAAGNTFHPANDRKYAIHTRFEFTAPRSAPFVLIVSKLRQNGIYPENDVDRFDPPRNPDDKHYSSLPISKLNLIVRIITFIVSSIDSTIDFTADPAGVSRTNCKIATTKPEKLNELLDSIRPRTAFTRPGIIILGDDFADRTTRLFPAQAGTSKV